MKIKTIKEGFDFIESFTNFEKRQPGSIREYRPERMSYLLDYFNFPEKSFRKVHVAGSKGKGSTAVFISSILSSAGYKTGLYTSPHVSSYKERISLAGSMIDDLIFLDFINRISLNIKNFIFRPTTFELLTLLSFLIFQSLKCDWAVIETGIGGRLDATNVIEPDICVLCPVEIEHRNLLGDSLESIASEKAGIIKKNIPVFSSRQTGIVKSTFLDKAEKAGTEIYFIEDIVDVIKTKISLPVMKIKILKKDKNNFSRISTSMIGQHQGENAGLAAVVCEYILNSIPPPSPAAGAIKRYIRLGIKKAFLPGRLEILQTKPYIILDAAHTPSSINRIIGVMKSLFSDNIILILGIIQGKEIEKISEVLSGNVQRIIVSTPGKFKKSNPMDVYKIVRKMHPLTELELLPRDALKRALSCSNGKKPILVAGSFYMISEIRSLIKNTPAVSLP